ncbi:hypothetical protein OE202_37935, partial [Klebsiella pneumoniae]|nr:hypothetical protein [Klebsiella pneumoniae]
LEREGAVKYSLRPLSPDYYPDEPGAVDVGRALEVVEYDGRELGDAFRDLRSPPPGMLLFGGMMVNRVDGFRDGPQALAAARGWDVARVAAF